MRPPSSLTELRDYYGAGHRVKYVFFWGHRPSRDGSITKNCLSQWFAASFEVDGVRYQSAEHFMMAEKARLFGDNDAVTRILKANNPGAAKAIGREVREFEEKVWIAHRCSVAIKGNFGKFSQNPSLHSSSGYWRPRLGRSEPGGPDMGYRPSRGRCGRAESGSVEGT